MSIRIEEQLKSEIEEERKKRGVDRSQIIRELLQEALQARRKEEAVNKYTAGQWGITEAARYSHLDTRAFIDVLNKSGYQEPFILKEFLERVEEARKIIREQEKPIE